MIFVRLTPQLKWSNIQQCGLKIQPAIFGHTIQSLTHHMQACYNVSTNALNHIPVYITSGQVSKVSGTTKYLIKVLHNIQHAQGSLHNRKGQLEAEKHASHQLILNGNTSMHILQHPHYCLSANSASSSDSFYSFHIRALFPSSPQSQQLFKYQGQKMHSKQPPPLLQCRSLV